MTQRKRHSCDGTLRMQSYEIKLGIIVKVNETEVYFSPFHSCYDAQFDLDSPMGGWPQCCILRKKYDKH